MSSKSDSTNHNDVSVKSADSKMSPAKNADKLGIKMNNGADDKKSSLSSTPSGKLATGGANSQISVCTKLSEESRDMQDKKAMSFPNNTSIKSIPTNSVPYTRGSQSSNAEKATDSDSSMNPNVVSVSSSTTGENSTSLTAPKNHSGYGGSNPHRGSRRPVGQATDYHSVGSTGSKAEHLSKTNLYIRGLSTETTDDDLYNMCAKFGNIVSTKAIQDKTSGHCRGYGFVLFSSPQSAEMAVKELTEIGVQAQMARIPLHNEQHTKHHSYQNSNNNSHYHHHQYHHNNQNNQLLNHGNNNHTAGNMNMMNNHSHNHGMNHGNIADPTNLYLANLPPNMGEAELEALLSNYGPVVSTRILRDEGYNPRGVGFARMESKDKCQEIIEKLNGKPYRDSREPLLVKFADGGNRKRHHNNHHHHHHNNSQHKLNHEEGRWREGGDSVDQNISQPSYDHQRNIQHGNHLTDMSLMGPMSYSRIQPTFPSNMTGNPPYPTALGPTTSTAQWIHPGSGQPWNVIPQMIPPSNLGPSTQAAVPANYPFGHLPQLTNQMQGLQITHHSGPPMSGYMPQWSPMWPHHMPPPQQNQTQPVRPAAPIQSPTPQQQQIPQVLPGASQAFTEVQEAPQTVPSKKSNSSDTDRQIHAPL